MAVDEDHIRRAEHNEAAYHHLDATSEDFADWQITALFYAAVHYTNAYLARKNFTPTDHAQRSFMVQTEQNLKAINTEYSELLDRGWESRYALVGFNSLAAHEIFSGAYRPFRNTIRHLLNLQTLS
jgi:uncharacterized protein (UPF0332 family)